MLSRSASPTPTRALLPQITSLINGLATKIAIIYDSSDAYSSGVHDKFKEEAATKGLEVVADEAFTADNKTDFSVQVQKAKSSGAELVFLPIYYSEANLIIQEMNSGAALPYSVVTVWMAC